MNDRTACILGHKTGLKQIIQDTIKFLNDLTYSWYFVHTGFYMYLEASKRSPGEQASLTSPPITTSGVACLSFWYHMYGRHIGNLQILANMAEDSQMVWFREKNQSSEYLLCTTSFSTFVQTAHWGNLYYLRLSLAFCSFFDIVFSR